MTTYSYNIYIKNSEGEIYARIHNLFHGVRVILYLSLSGWGSEAFFSVILQCKFKKFNFPEGPDHPPVLNPRMSGKYFTTP